MILRKQKKFCFSEYFLMLSIFILGLIFFASPFCFLFKTEAAKAQTQGERISSFQKTMDGTLFYTDWNNLLGYDGSKVYSGALPLGNFVPTFLPALMQGPLGINATPEGAQLRVKSGISGNNILSLINNSGTEVFSVLNSGNVGIGTINPSSNLHIAGTNATLKLSTAPGSDQLLTLVGGNGITQTISATYNLRLSSGNTRDILLTPGTTGNVGIGTTTPPHRLSIDGSSTNHSIDAGNKRIGSVADPEDGKDVVTLGYLDSSLSAFAPGGASSTWAISGNNIYNTNTTGNVGIGTSTPNYKLEVLGDSRFVDGITTNTWNRDGLGTTMEILTGRNKSFLTILISPSDNSGFVNVTTALGSTSITATTILNTTAYRLYLRSDSPFNTVGFWFNSFATNAGNIIVEYWNGSSWVAVSNKVDETSQLTQNGTISWDMPSNWVQNSVDSTTGYWIKIRSAISSNPDATANLILPIQYTANNLFEFSPNPLDTQTTGGIWVNTSGRVRIPTIDGAVRINGALTIAGALAGATTGAFSSTVTLTRTSVGAGTFNNLILTNSTAATSLSPQQNSPALNFSGRAWNGASAINSMSLQVSTIPGTPSGARFSFLNQTINGSANNDELMSILSDGLVGIGTTTPTTRLTLTPNVNHSIDAGNGRIGNVADPEHNKDVVTLGYLDSSLSAFAPGGASSTWAISGNNIYNTNTTGNVGIGTTNPSGKLTVNASAQNTNAIQIFSNSVNAGDYVGIGSYYANGNTNVNAQIRFINENQAGAPSALGFATGVNTSSTEKLRITSLGNVGIGTTNPGAKLDISSGLGNGLILGGDNSLTTRTDATTKYGRMAVPHYTNAEEPMTVFVGYTAATENGLQFGGGTSVGNAATLLQFFTAANNTTTLGTERMRIDSAGNVGIGTSNPLRKLQVSGISRFLDGFIGLDSSTEANRQIFFTNGDNLGSYASGALRASYLSFYNHSNEVMRLTSNNVGIGTTSPPHRLSISGSTTNYSIDAGNKRIGNVSDPDDNKDVVTLGYLNSSLSAFAPGGASSTWAINGNNIYNTNTTGNVGIGITTPRVKLDIVGANSKIRLAHNVQNAGEVGVEFSHSTYPGSSEVKSAIVTKPTLGFGRADMYFILDSAADSAGYVSDDTDTKMIIKNDGKVGIGTTSPSQKFDVAGNININEGSSYMYDGLSALRLTKGVDSHYANTFVGHASGNTTAERQTAVGYYAGQSNTGIYQTAIGYAAGLSNTGSIQTAIGYVAGYQNTGSFQTALGYAAGYSNTGNHQTAIGYATGQSNTGNHQTALGYYAGYQNTGHGVTGIGYEATRGNQKNDVVAIGYQAGRDNTLANQFIVKQANVNAIPLIQGNFSSGNVGIGTTTPATRLTLTPNVNHSIDAGNGRIGNVANPSDDKDVVTLGYLNSSITSSASNYLPLVGGTLSGPLNMGGNNITNINKLTVNTIDPLYRIKGINYSTFAAAIVGGVKEEYVGRIELDKKNSNGEFEVVIDFRKQKEGSDLWVWRKTVDFSKDNIEVFITPYGNFAQTYFLIEGEKLIIRSNKAVSASYRLIGRRIDWREWPTKAHDQEEIPGFIIH